MFCISSAQHCIVWWIVGRSNQKTGAVPFPCTFVRTPVQVHKTLDLIAVCLYMGGHRDVLIERMYLLAEHVGYKWVRYEVYVGIRVAR
jgi:hypothetical protein